MQINLNQQVFCKMEHRYLSEFQKQQGECGVELLKSREETLECHLECIRQASGLLLSLYSVIKFKVVLDVMVLLQFEMHDDRAHQVQ